MKTPILCRLGLHSWKPVYRPGWMTYPSGARIAFSGPGWIDFGWKQVACQCRRCGKRVVLP